MLSPLPSSRVRNAPAYRRAIVLFEIGAGPVAVAGPVAFACPRAFAGPVATAGAATLLASWLANFSLMRNSYTVESVVAGPRLALSNPGTAASPDRRL